MKIEMNRVRDLLGDAISQVAIEAGDIRFFNAAFLSAAMLLHSEVEGPESLDKAIAKIAARELVRSGEAGAC